MRKLFKSLVPILLVISMIFTLGIESISEGELKLENEIKQEEAVRPPVEAKTEEKPLEEIPETPIAGPIEEKPEPIKPAEPTGPVAPVEPTDPDEPIKPVAPVEPTDPGIPVEPAEPIKPTEPVEEEDLQNPNEIVEEDKVAEEIQEEVVLEPLHIDLTNATILLGDFISLGSGTNPQGENYMSDATGGDGEYSYEWKVLGEDLAFSNVNNPTVNPSKSTTYLLTLKDLSGGSFTATMTVEVKSGSLKITNIVKNINTKDLDKEFDIFINGPNGSLYTVSLKHGQSITLNNLNGGVYSISTILPMNYKLLDGIVYKTIPITLNNLKDQSTLTYTRTNNSWFYSQ